MNWLLAGAAENDISETLQHFDAYGYARLGRVLNDEGLALLRQRANALMLGEVTYPGLFFQMDSPTGRYEDAPIGLGWQGPSLNYRKLEKLELDEHFRHWLRNPLFERIARARIEGAVVLYRAILFNKAAEGGSDIPWHQDGGKLWGLSQTPTLQIWTALDDAPVDGGCIEAVPISHTWGLASELGGVVPKEKVDAARADQVAVSIPCVAGESILINNLLWHRSGRTLTGQRRLGFSACYMSAQVRCLRKKRAPRVFFRVFP
ncbi:MAG: phytanoyl-CoA dioxygenase family protein [Myxococcaceae bacterium]|nr:phytanoyl-CoA dioxygenase family protein [Myxococcaceae bacterium]